MNVSSPISSSVLARNLGDAVQRQGEASQPAVIDLHDEETPRVCS